jgi:hypothetical protein
MSMVHRTRCGFAGVGGPRAAAKRAVLVLTVATVACSVPLGLRAQELTRPNGPPTGPITLPKPPPDSPGEPKEPPPPGQEQPVPPGVEQPPVIVPIPDAPAIFDGPAPPPRRFNITIDPKTPLKDLLPTPPKAKAHAHRGPAEDLASVPELDFQAALPKNFNQEQAAHHTAQMLAQIDFLNGKKADGFLEALRADRPDLNGLPFAMGDACRTKGERNRQFTIAVNAVRQALQTAVATPDPQTGQPGGEREQADNFWQQFAAICAQQDRGASQIDRPQRDAVARARAAALMQVLAPEKPDLRMGLVKYLSAVPQAEATQDLARLAIFSAEDEVRQTAVEALQVRRERDYTDVLVRGLHYPWPAVARRSAEVVAKLERTDLLAQLVGLLDEPDPRLPASERIDDKPAQVVREVVRVNHHRNCMLCHSPGDTEGVSADTLRGPIPLPTDPLGVPSNGYQQSQFPEFAVRIDVTYLRQDFSLMQPVEDANPWPEMQRFDFLVRTRTVTDEEAADYRKALDKREAGRPSPYQRAALVALRDMTGKDAAPTAEAWRRVLDLPASQK